MEHSGQNISKGNQRRCGVNSHGDVHWATQIWSNYFLSFRFRFIACIIITMAMIFFFSSLKKRKHLHFSPSLHPVFVCSAAELEEAYSGTWVLPGLFHVLTRFSAIIWRTISSGEKSLLGGCFPPLTKPNEDHGISGRLVLADVGNKSC